MNKEIAALGVVIRRVRKTRQLSQVKLAELCGFHRSYVSDVERGERNLTFISLLKLARALQTSVSHIAREAESDSAKPLFPKHAPGSRSAGREPDPPRPLAG
jgi:transcriptional regulator with XRE-family HTH domain